jgi:hypothetical protein
LFIRWQDPESSKWVKRLNLIFDQEDTAAFRYRLKQARRRQKEVRGAHRLAGIVKAHQAVAAS